MKLHDTQITNYLTFCKSQKCLDDQKQFAPIKLISHNFASTMPAENFLIRHRFPADRNPISHTCTPYISLKTAKRKNCIPQSIFSLLRILWIYRKKSLWQNPDPLPGTCYSPKNHSVTDIRTFSLHNIQPAAACNHILPAKKCSAWRCRNWTALCHRNPHFRTVQFKILRCQPEWQFCPDLWKRL